MMGNCLTWYLLSWFDIGLHMLQNRFQVVFIANTQIFNLDFPLLGPVFGDLRGIWNSYRKTNWNECCERVTLYNSPLSPSLLPGHFPLSHWRNEAPVPCQGEAELGTAWQVLGFQISTCRERGQIVKHLLALQQGEAKWAENVVSGQC